VSGYLSPLGAPFRALWHALRQIAALDRTQVRSLVTVGFLAGMVSLSAENWFITFYLDRIIESPLIKEAAQDKFIAFLADRMRNTSILQGLIALVLGAVILNADRMSVKAAGFEAAIGSSGGAPGERAAGRAVSDSPSPGGFV
jgi:hypothetical protein